MGAAGWLAGLAVAAAVAPPELGPPTRLPPAPPARVAAPALPVDAASDAAVVAALAEVLGRPVPGAVVTRWRERVYVEAPQRIAGREVWGGGVSGRIVAGRLALVLDRTVAAPPAAARGPDDRWILVDPDGGPARSARGAVLVPAPLVGEGLGTAAGAWTLGPYRWPEGAFLTGSVRAEHHARGVDGSPLVTSPLPRVGVADGFADDAGDYDVVADLPVTVSLEGAYARVEGDRARIYTHASADPDVVLAAPDAVVTEEDQSVLDAYVHVHEIREWGRRVAPDNDWVTDPITVEVDQGLAGCNAYFFGRTIQFFPPVRACWPTAQNADIVYHEWGHGLHFHGRVAGTFDLALSEGAADVVAYLQTRDPEIGRFMYKDGTGIRNLAERFVYPDDVLLEDAHGTGRIFGGAAYDLHRLLVARDGDEAGTATFEALFVALLAAGPSMDDVFDEALAADDDDGVLANGTPNECDLAMAFGRHGYGPLVAGWDLSAEHAPSDAPPAGAPIALALDAVEGAIPRCLGPAAAGGELAWSVDGVDQDPLPAAGVALAATLPPQVEGAVVRYTFSGALRDGTAYEAGPYTLTVGPGAAPPPPPADTGDAPATVGDDGDRASPADDGSGCGCGAAGRPAWAALGGSLALLRRRRSAGAR